jgi:hypothetical protein
MNFSLSYSREARASRINGCCIVIDKGDCSLCSREQPGWAAITAATSSANIAVQDSNVLLGSSRKDVNQISVAGMQGLSAACKSNPLRCRVVASDLKMAGTSSGSSRCISIRLSGREPSVPTTRTLLMLTRGLAANIPRATSPAQRCFLSGELAPAVSFVSRGTDADDRVTWLFAAWVLTGPWSLCPVARPPRRHG